MIKSPVDRFVPLAPVESTGLPRVYRISADYVLMFDARTNRENTRQYLNEETDRLKHEAQIQIKLQHSDHNVPVSLGVTHYKLPQGTWFARRGDLVAAHLMRHVEGISVTKLPENSPHRESALEQHARMIDQIGNDYSLDVTPLNPGLKRAIWTPDKTVCLYDFKGWTQGTN